MKTWILPSSLVGERGLNSKVPDLAKVLIDLASERDRLNVAIAALKRLEEHSLFVAHTKPAGSPKQKAATTHRETVTRIRRPHT